MIFKSALITQASGSIGGITFGRNRGGLYIRGRGIPTNPNTLAQQAARQAMKTSIDSWQLTLTQAQRDEWITYGANTPHINHLGDQILLTGQQQYIRSNNPRQRAGLTRINNGPSIFNIGTFTAVSFIVDGAQPKDLVITFDNTDAWANITGGALVVQASRGQNGTRTNISNAFQFAGNIAGDTVTPPTSPATISSPFSYVAGQRVFLRVSATQGDGRYSTAQEPLTGVI